MLPRRSSLALLASVLVALTFAAQAQAFKAGEVDTSFGSAGQLIGSGGVLATRIQPDGKILTLSDGIDGVYLTPVVTRYLPSGALDTGFGVGGTTPTVGFGGNVNAEAMTLLPNGKIQVIGNKYSSGEIVFERYGSNGQFDTTWGVPPQGYESRSFNGSGADARAVLVQSGSGRVIAAGQRMGTYEFGMLGLFENGDTILNNSWGTSGQTGTVVTSFGGGTQSRIETLIELPSTSLLAAGGAFIDGHNEAGLVRYFDNGAIDTSFGAGGLSNTKFDGSFYAGKAAIDAQGRIYVSGTPGSDGGLGVVRFLSGGSVDTTFGVAGLASVSPSGGGFAKAVAISPDGSVVVVGGAPDAAAGRAFDVARFTSSGAPDSGFGTGGLVETDLPDEAYATDVAVLANGDILAVGGSGTKVVGVKYHGNSTVTPVLTPTSKITSPSKSKLKRKKFKKVSGTAGPVGSVKRVEISIRQTYKGDLKQKKCVWLKSNKAKFKRKSFKRKKTCPTPVWLKASGTKSWSYKLKKSLPAGKYEISARTTLLDGSTQTAFTKASGNFRKLTLTK